jgi:hypothetical protein
MGLLLLAKADCQRLIAEKLTAVFWLRLCRAMSRVWSSNLKR